MKLRFIGGVDGVTGSKTVIETSDEKYLVDYGLYQGGKNTRALNWQRHIKASDITAVILTHAHIDHSGLLPRLFKDGYRGPIYCTRETFKLCEVLLLDAAKLQQEDSNYHNKKKCSSHKPALPLYTTEDAEGILEQFNPIDFNVETELSSALSISFYWAGHILGASFVKINITDVELGVSKTVVFSGDIGHSRGIILNPPVQLPKADALILESTYGDRLHSRVPAEEILENYLNVILKRGGVAIIPSFSVGRTQDILHIIKKLLDDKKIPEVPIVLDSPMSRKANGIFLNSFDERFIKPEVMELSRTGVFPHNLDEVGSIVESQAINNKRGPMIIVSASGMMDGGRVVHHVKKRISDDKNGVIFVGFQPQGTKGRILLDGAQMLRLHKEEFEVKADIFYVNSLSAHGDYLDLLEWLQGAEELPKFIIFNHGEPESSRKMKLIIDSKLNIKSTIAHQDEVFELSNLLS